MHYLDIKFGKSVGHLILDEQFKHLILNKLDTILKKEAMLSLSDKDMNKKTKSPLVTSNKSVYTRYIIPGPKVYLLLCIINNIKLTLFIYDNYIIYSHILFDKKLYALDSYILFTGNFNNNYYIINDISLNNTSSSNSVSPTAKFKQINTILRNLYYPIPDLDTHDLVFIDFVDKYYLFSLCTDYYEQCFYTKNMKIDEVIIKDFNNNTTGIFKLDFIINYFIIKNKPETPKYELSKTNINIPISFIGIIKLKMYKTDKPDIYHLYSLDNKVYYGIADIPTMEISAYVISIFPPKYVFIITSFIFDEKYKRWRPIPICISKKPNK